MLIEEQVAGFKPILCGVLLIATLFANVVYAETRFHLEKDAQGSIKAFKAVSVPLPDFLREYSRLSGTPITADGVWAKELKGNVTLLMRKPLKPEEMTELVHRVLNDNGYAVVDAPAGNGWVIEWGRNARDAALPVYEATDVPLTNRLITVHQTLKYADSEGIARMMRSFMPSNSRIIPATRSQLLVTDTGANIRKLLPVIARMDTEDAAKRQREFLANYASGPQRTCGEQRIEKLVVEKLEIQDSVNGNSASGAPVKRVIKGAQK
jgi:type II secretory pathway component GspD/PulD (secretin)